MKNSKHEESMQQNRSSNSDQVSGERRRLTKAGLVAPVLMSFSSRPAWAATCTLSGMLSGNISGPFGECASALSADYWNDNREQWGGRNNENVNTFFGLGNFFTDSTTFESIYDGDYEINSENDKENCWNSNKFERHLIPLLRQAIAAILNADNFSTYPATVSEIQNDVADVYVQYASTTANNVCNQTDALDTLMERYQTWNTVNPYP